MGLGIKKRTVDGEGRTLSLEMDDGRIVERRLAAVVMTGHQASALGIDTGGIASFRISLDGVMSWATPEYRLVRDDDLVWVLKSDLFPCHPGTAELDTLPHFVVGKVCGNIAHLERR